MPFLIPLLLEAQDVFRRRSHKLFAAPPEGVIRSRCLAVSWLRDYSPLMMKDTFLTFEMTWNPISLKSFSSN